MDTEVKYRVKEVCKVLSSLESATSCRILGIEAKRGLYEGVVVPSVISVAETSGTSVEERCRWNVPQIE